MKSRLYCGVFESQRPFRADFRNRCVTGTGHEVIVDHPHRLHEGVNDRGAAELEPFGLEVLRNLRRKGGLRRDLRLQRPAVLQGRIVHVGPEEAIEPTAGLKTLRVSGRFTFFSERIRSRLQLDFARANTLGVADGRLTGTLFDRPWGDIVDGAEKKRVLLEVCELMGIPTSQAIAVGDGANDLPMMEAAGLSIAYHPKPAVAARAMLSILDGGLDRALEVLTVD